MIRREQSFSISGSNILTPHVRFLPGVTFGELGGVKTSVYSPTTRDLNYACLKNGLQLSGARQGEDDNTNRNIYRISSNKLPPSIKRPLRVR